MSLDAFFYIFVHFQIDYKTCIVGVICSPNVSFYIVKCESELQTIQ